MAVRSAGVLAPKVPLAVLDVHISTSTVPSAEAFWLSELGYSIPPPRSSDIGRERQRLFDRWGDARAGIAICHAPGGEAAQISVDKRRFGATWIGGGQAEDALAALTWVLDGFAAERFVRAVVGAVAPDGSETWLALQPFDAAKAEGLSVHALWRERVPVEAARLVTLAGGGDAEATALVTAALPAGPAAAPMRTLWAVPDSEPARANAVLTACAGAVLALAYRTLPPSRGRGDGHGPRERGFGRFSRARPWLREPGPERRTALALVSAGGDRQVLAFSDAEGVAPDPRSLPAPARLFVVSASSEAALLAEIEALGQRVPDESSGSAALADELWLRPRHRHRCAIVASGAADLARKLATAAARLKGAAAPSPRDRILIGASEHAGAPIAFVIPGQGTQYPGLLRELALLSSPVRSAFERLADAFAERKLSLPPLLHPAQDVIGTEVGKEVEEFWREVGGGGLVGSVASQVFQEFLRDHGVRPAILLGHSMGETTALALAEALGPKPPDHMAAMARSFAGLRSALLGMGRSLFDTGLAVSGAARAAIERALAAQSGRVFLALDNCPHQVVLLGEPPALQAVSTELRAGGAACLEVWLGAPFHTPLLEAGMPSMAAFYDRLGIRAPSLPVWSGAAKAPFPADPTQVRSLLLRQWTDTVRFADSVRALHRRGIRVFIEVGPGDTLTGFVGDTLSGLDHLALACDSQWFGGLEHLLAVLGRLFVAGIEVRPPARAELAAASAQGSAESAAAAVIREQHAALLREAAASEARVLERLGSRPVSLPYATARELPPLGALGSVRPQDGGDGTIVLERRVDLESDPYLRDHVFGRIKAPYAETLTALPVVPLVMTLETLGAAALAAAGRAAGGAVVTSIDRLRLHRWLALDRGYLDLRAVARLELRPGRPIPTVHVSLFEFHPAAPAGRWSAAEATVELDAAYAPPPQGLRLVGRDFEPKISAERFLQNSIFQGPAFRAFHRLLRLTDEGIEAEIVVPPRDRLFGDQVRPRLATGANLIDAAGQVVARWIDERWTGWYGAFPFYAESYEQFAALPPAGERLRCVAFIKDHGDVAAADVEFQRADGAVLYRYRDLRHRRFDLTADLMACIRTYDVEYWLTEPLVVGRSPVARLLDGERHDLVRPDRGIFLQSVAHGVLTARERETWVALPQGSPRRAQWLMGRIAAKDAVRQWASERHGVSLSPLDVEVTSDDLGKPEVRLLGNSPQLSLPELSISHGGNLAIAVVAEDAAIGVDIEEQRADGPRRVPDLAFAEGELAAAERASMPPIALWCAKEAAAKALGVGLLGEPRRWRVRDLAPDGRSALVGIEGFLVPVTLHVGERAVVALAQVRRETAAEARATLRAAGAKAKAGA